MKVTHLNAVRLEDGRLLLLTKFGRIYHVQTVDHDGHVEKIAWSYSRKTATLYYQDELNQDVLID